ncbi:hypothetical protein M9H77_35060 [Catharanthus roseus]|uniref:Uncharacterized protein n=1 Tax=Catharanthus roseus TaxID=4058 RepID=A0ACB9ZN74_CATRO|nr:hypothetical protein M9H77_35060 [Catharanthus roseus]
MYNPGWRNHPNFSWVGQGQQRTQNPPGFQNRGAPLPLPYEAGLQSQPPLAKANLEELMVKFMSVTDNIMNTIEAAQRNQETSIRNLEKQIGQLVKLHVNAISVTVEEENSVKEEGVISPKESCTEEERRSSGKSDEEKVDTTEEFGKKKSTSTPYKSKVHKYGRHLKDMITKKDKLQEASIHSVCEFAGNAPRKGKERPKDTEKGGRLSSNFKARLLKWVLVQYMKEAMPKKYPNDRVRGGTFSS